MSVKPLVPLSLQVNGRPVALAVPPSTLLVDLLREQLALTGTHQGCDTAQCGACTVLVDGAATKSCNVLALQVNGASVLTIEGLEAADGSLHPMQQAFGRHHALQCGFARRAWSCAAWPWRLRACRLRRKLSARRCAATCAAAPVTAVLSTPCVKACRICGHPARAEPQRDGL